MGNELKLSLENFQSISEGELIFHSGINVLVGQSNSGKSATFRALKACLLNGTGSQRFIKKGKKESSVTLEYNGNQIIWKRTPKESSYIVNGELFTKTGSSSAQKIVGDTGFVVDTDNNVMNIEEELQLPFPYGISKFDLFKLYENVFCISDSATILKSAKEQEDKVKSEISAAENEIVKNKNKLEEIANFKKSVDIKKLKEAKATLIQKRDKIAELKEGLPEIKRAYRVQGVSVPEVTFMNRLKEYNESLDTKSTIVKLKAICVLQKELKTVTYTPLELLLTYKEALDTQSIMGTLKNLKNLSAPEVSFENKLSKYEELTKYTKDLKNLTAAIKIKSQNLKEVQEKITQISKELEKYDVCPLCHSPLK